MLKNYKISYKNTYTLNRTFKTRFADYEVIRCVIWITLDKLTYVSKSYTKI